jgi:ATP-binding cassette, subfamily B, bacterial
MARPQTLRETLPSTWHILRYFWPLIRQERGLIAGSVALLLASTFMKLAEPWPLAFILDSVIPNPSGGTGVPALDGMDTKTMLVVLAIAVVVITTLRAFAGYFQRMGFAKVGNRVLLQVRERLYLHLQKLSLAFHTSARGGDLTVRVTRDVSLLRDVASTALIPLVVSAFMLVAMAIVMLLLEWRLALLALATAPLFWFSTIKIGRSIQGVARKQRKREGALASTTAESMSAIKVVQALSLEDAFADEFAENNSRSQKEDLKGQRLSAKLERTVDVLMAIATALVMGFGGWFVIEGTMTAGHLTVFLFYLRRAFRPAKDFAKYTARLAKATAAAERVLAVLELKPDVRDDPNAKPAPTFAGEVHFENLSFGYEGDSTILDGIDFRVRPGQLMALVGRSGIGKSTIVDLLMRLYEPTAGRVLIDGTDIREVTLASLRRQISVVLQDSVLFAGTIRENIAYGISDATDERVETAARLAGAHEFLNDLADGYDTLVGERGATLSNGQRQRIAIARCAMRDTPILILDEPTTGLDEENERLVVQALKRLAAGRTTLLITHDLRLAAQADVVAYLENGELVERGSHDELLRHGGEYQRLYDLQTSAGGSR